MGIKSGKFKDVIEDYFKKFEKEPWYKGHFCSESEGKFSLPFKNSQDLTDFCRDQAAKYRNFTILDGATKKVMAYSQGGKFFHADGKEVKDGDKFTPSDKTHEQFKILTTPIRSVDDAMSQVAKTADSVLPSSKSTSQSRSTDSQQEPQRKVVKGESHGGPPQQQSATPASLKQALSVYDKVQQSTVFGVESEVDQAQDKNQDQNKDQDEGEGVHLN